MLYPRAFGPGGVEHEHALLFTETSRLLRLEQECLYTLITALRGRVSSRAGAHGTRSHHKINASQGTENKVSAIIKDGS